MSLRSHCDTSTAISSQSFFFFFNFYFTYNFFKNFTNFRLINPSPIINLYNKSQSTLYLFTSTIKPSPRHFQLKGKIWNCGTLKGCAWEAQHEDNQRVQRYASTLRFHSNDFKDNQRVWKSPHLLAIRFHSNGRLSEFLPCYLPLLIVYKYLQNLADSIEVSLNSSSFCALLFCLMFMVSPFTFCYGLFHGVVWMIVMVAVVFNWCTDRSYRNNASSLSFDLYGLVVVVCCLVLNT